MDDTAIMQLLTKMSTTGTEGRPIDPRWLASVTAKTPSGFKTEWTSESPSREQFKFDTVQYLEALRVDLTGEVCGETRPIAGVNYVAVLARFMILFMQIEDELKRRRNRAWVQAYERPSTLAGEKRVALTMMALAGLDEECLRVMAEQFQNPRDGFMHHVYWGDLETLSSMAREDDNPLGPDNCAVM